MATYSSKPEIYVNGRIQMEAQSFDVSASSGAQRVSTIQRGATGHTGAMPQFDVSVKSAVPIKGVEFDPFKYLNSQQEIKITVKMNGSDKVSGVGRVSSAKFSAATGSETAIDFTVECYEPKSG